MFLLVSALLHRYEGYPEEIRFVFIWTGDLVGAVKYLMVKFQRDGLRMKEQSPQKAASDILIYLFL